MKFPFFSPIAPGDISAIINIALHELGLTEAFLIRALSTMGGSPKFLTTGEWDYTQFGVSEWYLIANALCLPFDSISIGYMRMTHKAWVGNALLEGTCVLPATPQLRTLFLEYIDDRVLHLTKPSQAGPKIL